MLGEGEGAIALADILSQCSVKSGLEVILDPSLMKQHSRYSNRIVS